MRVAEADRAGRHLEADGFPAGTWLLSRAQALEVTSAAPSPIVLGRHLIELGLQPGPHFGPILEACYEAQIEGVFLALADGKRYALQWIAADRTGGSRSSGGDGQEKDRQPIDARRSPEARRLRRRREPPAVGSQPMLAEPVRLGTAPVHAEGGPHMGIMASCSSVRQGSARLFPFPQPETVAQGGPGCALLHCRRL